MNDTVTVTQKKQPSIDVFSSIDNQELTQIIQQSGIYMRGAVEPWEMNGNSGESCTFQLAIKAFDNSYKLKLLTVKVPEELRGVVDLMNRSKQLKPITLQLELRESFNKISYHLVAEQPHLKAS